MKYVNKRIVLFLLCLCLSPVKAGTPPLISLEFQSSPVGLVLQALADARQLNLVTAPGLDGQMSVKLKDVPWQQALDIILQMNHLTSQLQGNVLLVSPEEDPQVVQQRIKDAADQQALQSPLISLTVPLQYADAKETALSLNAQKGSLLSQKGNASADTRTNTLLLRDTQAALDVVAPWVKEMDLPLQQVQLAAHIVTMNSEITPPAGPAGGAYRHHEQRKPARTWSALGIYRGGTHYKSGAHEQFQYGNAGRKSDIYCRLQSCTHQRADP